MEKGKTRKMVISHLFIVWSTERTVINIYCYYSIISQLLFRLINGSFSDQNMIQLLYV